jgi:hypothetical protein
MWWRDYLRLRHVNALRQALGRSRLPVNRRGWPHYVFPQVGEFFEYRFTPEEFVDLCQQAGFTVEASHPIAHIDGLYHELGRVAARFRRWQLHPTVLGAWLDRQLRRYRFFHNHMQACILRK